MLYDFILSDGQTKISWGPWCSTSCRPQQHGHPGTVRTANRWHHPDARYRSGPKIIDHSTNPWRIAFYARPLWSGASRRSCPHSYPSRSRPADAESGHREVVLMKSAKTILNEIRKKLYFFVRDLRSVKKSNWCCVILKRRKFKFLDILKDVPQIIQSKVFIRLLPFGLISVSFLLTIFKVG
jgi:hypothetical protein